jgi:hypothetical protein
MTKSSGKVIGLKVESFREEDSPKNLAIRLADFLQEEMAARTDAREFKAQAVRERRKAKDFSGVLIMLNEYQRKKKSALASGEEWEPSRMEPMESYDEEIIRDERIMLINRAKRLDKKANKHEKIAEKAKLAAAEVQKKLMDISRE